MATDDDDDEENSDLTSYVEMSDGFLTPRDRKYIADEKNPDDPQTERNIRQKIRNRTLASFLDFRALEHFLDAKDRKLIFNRMVEENNEELIEAVQEGENRIKLTKQYWFGGAVATLQFIYEGLMETDIDQTAVFEHAIRKAEISKLTDENIQAIIKKIEDGDRLDQDEKQLLTRLFVENPEEYTNRLAAVDIDFESRMQADEALSPGESFAVLGYMMEYPDRVPSDSQPILHEEVRGIAFPDAF